MAGSSPWMPCAPQGVKGFDDDDDDDVQMRKKKYLSIIYSMASGKTVPVQMLTRHRLDSISGAKFCSNSNYLRRPSSCNSRSRVM